MASKKQQQGKSQEQIVQGFQELRQQQRNLASKISELEMDMKEHELVIETLKDVDEKRRCFRLVGGVLVERTVHDVLPALVNNKEQMMDKLTADRNVTPSTRTPDPVTSHSPGHYHKMMDKLTADRNVTPSTRTPDPVTSHSPGHDHKNLDRVTEVEDVIEQQGGKNSSLDLVHKLIQCHLEVSKNPHKALHYLVSLNKMSDSSGEHQKNESRYLPNRFLPVKTAILFAESQDIDSAIKVLQQIEVHRPSGYTHNATVRRQYHSLLTKLFSLCENFEQMCDIILAGTQNGYLHLPHDREAAWKNFFNNVAESGDLDTMTRAVKFVYSNDPGNSFTAGIHNLFVALIHTGNTEALSEIQPTVRTHLELSMEGDGESMLNQVMATAFLEAGNREMTAKIVENPDFELDQRLVWQFYDYCLRINKPDLMEKLYDVLRNKPSIDRDKLLFMCMKAYRNASPPNEEAVEYIFEVKYREDSVVPSGSSRALYRSILDKFRGPYLKS